jgi:hypothetical protein
MDVYVIYFQSMFNFSSWTSGFDPRLPLLESEICKHPPAGWHHQIRSHLKQPLLDFIPTQTPF